MIGFWPILERPAAHPGYDVGRWYGPAGGSTVAQNLNNPGVLFFFPFRLQAPTRIDQLAIGNATAAGAGIKGRLGLYAHDLSTKRPGALIAEATADLDMTLGSRPLTAAIGTTPLLPAGFVWGAACFSGLVTVSCVVYDQANDDIIQWFGSSTPWNSYSSWVFDIVRTAPLAYSVGSPFFPPTAGAITGIPSLTTNGSPSMSWRAA